MGNPLSCLASLLLAAAASEATIFSLIWLALSKFFSEEFASAATSLDALLSADKVSSAAFNLAIFTSTALFSPALSSAANASAACASPDTLSSASTSASRSHSGAWDLRSYFGWQTLFFLLFRSGTRAGVEAALTLLESTQTMRKIHSQLALPVFFCMVYPLLLSCCPLLLHMKGCRKASETELTD